MMRSPLAYPLNRSADMDAGGAADLQTDIMRFMAILSLCLVAIFALVQSIPLKPTETVAPVEPDTPVEQAQAKATVGDEQDIARAKPQQEAAAVPLKERAEAPVTLTRPKWQSRIVAAGRLSDLPEPAAEAPDTTSAARTAPPAQETAPPMEKESEGFTLRFESDAALTRLVAANRVGLYAVAGGRAQRMSVSESRISFWEASTPHIYHEMESGTVPGPVIEALARTGMATTAVSWGVTLPGRLTTQLDALMLKHRGGSLIIVASGDIRWEDS